MFTQFEIDWLYANRKKLTGFIDGHSESFLLTIPQGYNNNILWQIGHIVVSQQRVLYMRSGLPMHISTTYHDLFKNGTSPAAWLSKPDIAEVKHSLLDTIEKLKKDLATGIFQTYEPMVFPMGYSVNNHLEGVSYTNLHEAEHTGNIQSMIRLMNSNV